MPIALVAAGIAGAATIAGSAISSNATKSAANTEATAAANNTALDKQIYASNTALSQPYVDRGNQAADLINNFTGISGDPAKASAALQTYLNSTGYQFRVNQGTSAITSNRAASGLLDSGGTLKALDTYGQNTAAAGANDWLNSLYQVSQQGVGAIGAVTGAGNTLANQVTATNNNAADATANAGLVSASNQTNLIGSLASTFNNVLGQSSYKSPTPASTSNTQTVPY